MVTGEYNSVRVLVVDDEAAICRIVTRTLKRNGFEADSVSSRVELEARLQVGEFQVILLDRSMDVDDNDRLLPVVRRLAPSAKVLFFTGDYVEPSEVAEVDGVVQKPINGRALADTLRALF
jgi:DNA-binding response OmpR family regulator